MSIQAERALELFQSGFNCSQAVLAAHSSDFNLDPEIALRLASGFGSGIARRQEMCGAVTGALMVSGLRCGRATLEDTGAVERAYADAQRIIQGFVELHGTVSCRELLGCDLTTSQGRQKAAAAGLFATKCARFVADAARLAVL